MGTEQVENQAGEGVENTNSDLAGGAGGQQAPENANGAKDAESIKSDSTPEDDKPKDGEAKPEDKPEEEEAEGKPKGEDKPKDGDKAEGAPEEYAAFNLPDGTQVDDELMGDFTSFAKGKNLSQEAAQEAIDLFAKAQAKAATLQQEKWDEIKESWAEETRADKELHDADGKADAAIAAARKTVEAVGGSALQEALDLTGAGNHPAVVKAFSKLSKLVLEDNDVVFGGGSADNRSRAEKLFPSMRKK